MIPSARSPAPDLPLALQRQLDFASRLTLAFEAQGHELYLVGGAVRDALLGSASTELDFATSSPPARTAEVLERFGSHTPYRVGEKYGTIGCSIENWTVEITTYRSREVYPAGSRKPSVEFGRTLEEDLSRRDFTINAIAFHSTTERWIDPFGGAHDLRAGVVRAVGDPTQRFREDPLRLLRAVRFAARYDFEIESVTENAMETEAGTLRSISRERIRDEYSHYLTSRRPAAALTLLRDSGLLVTSVPELDELTRMPDHGANHPLSLWDHTMRVVNAVPAHVTLRWAALLHDIAKPETRTSEPDGRTRFFHHEVRGAEIARKVLTGLRYPSKVSDSVVLLVETHMQIHAFSSEWSDGAVRRLCLRLGPYMEDAILLARADAAGHSADGTSANSPKLDELERRLRNLDSEEVQSLKSPLSGDELMRRYSRPPGPWIREVKERLLDQVLEGKLEPDDTEAAWIVADTLVTDGA
jgi:poly(A) polymerase